MWDNLVGGRRAFSATSFLGHGTVMFGATSTVNGVNYLFHVLMSRSLGPADYGILGALLSMLTILSLITLPINTVVAKYSTQYLVTGLMSAVNSFLRRSWKIALGYGILLTFVVGVFSHVIAVWFNLPSNKLVWLLGLITVFIAIVAVSRGILQGIQAFRALGVNMVLEAIVKLFGGVFLVQLGFNVGGAMAGIGLGAGVAWIAGIYPLRSIIREPQIDRNNFPWLEISQYFGSAFVTLLCFTALTNFDVIIARRLLPADQAGFYTAASTLSKIILYFPGAIALVIFPKSTQEFALGRTGWSIVGKGIAIVTLLSITMVVIFFLIPKVFVMLLFGDAFITIAPFIGWLGFGMSMYGILRVLMYYLLSIENRIFPWIMLGGLAVEIILLTSIPQTILSLITIVNSVGLGLMIIGILMSLRSAHNLQI